MADDPPPLSIASRQSDEELKRREILSDIEWPTREFIANLFRVIRGAGRPYILTSQMLQLANTLAEAHKFAGAWDVNETFLEAASKALPDWDWGEDRRGDLHDVLRGALQVMASTAVCQGTQQIAGQHEMMRGINSIHDRRDAERKKREEEYCEYLRSIKPAPVKRRAKRKPSPKRPAPPPVVARKAPAIPPEPEPTPRTTAEVMRINAQRLREGKEPI